MDKEQSRFWIYLRKMFLGLRTKLLLYFISRDFKINWLISTEVWSNKVDYKQ